MAKKNSSNRIKLKNPVTENSENKFEQKTKSVYRTEVVKESYLETFYTERSDSEYARFWLNFLHNE